MSVWDTLVVMIRRWRLSVPALLLALLAGVGAFFLAPPRYDTEIDLLFINSPSVPGEPELLNPFNSFGDSLVQTADVVRIVVTNPANSERLERSGLTAKYDVTLDVTTSAPVLEVTAQDASAELSLKTARTVQSLAISTLQDIQRQAGAPEKTFIRTVVISDTPEPERNYTPQIRLAVVVFAGLLAGLLLAMYVLEGVRLRRAADGSKRPGASHDQAAGDGSQDWQGTSEELLRWPVSAGAAPGASSGPEQTPAAATREGSS